MWEGARRGGMTYIRGMSKPLLEQLQDAIYSVSATRSPAPPSPVNARSYPCSHAGCGRAAYARGLCNGHYLRRRSGASMDRPFKHVKMGNECTECGARIAGKGGWGLCQKHYRAARTAEIKAVIVAHKGGSCQHCKGVFPLPVFDLHHTGPKEGSISEMIANASISALAEEVADCILLCANCHRIEHASEPLRTMPRRSS